jgi:hypothetical protein
VGYTHYWYRPKNIAQVVFHSIRIDFERLILPLADAGVELAGGMGEGAPIINDDGIWLNGVADCGHPQNEEIIIPYPADDAHGVGPSSTAVDEGSDGLVTRVKHRCCDGCCRYETFDLPRCLEAEEDPYIGFVKTGFRPYDVAVTAALLISKRHLKEEFTIHSDGGDAQWLDARQICQRVLGYGDWFGIVEELVEEDLPGNPVEKRQVRLRTLVELDPVSLGY